MWTFIFTLADPNANKCSCPKLQIYAVFLCGLLFGLVLNTLLKVALRLKTCYQEDDVEKERKNKQATKTKTCGNHQSIQISNMLAPKNMEGRQILEEALLLFAEQMNKSGDNSKVVEYISPEEMLTKLFSDREHISRAQVSMALSEGLALKKDRKGAEIVHCFREIQKYSVNTNHPYFFNQLFGALDPVAVAAELVALSVNTSAYTYETAPVFTIMEREVFSRLGSLVFETNDTDSNADDEPRKQYDGLMLPGGSLSNLTALHIARYYAQTCDVNKRVICESYNDNSTIDDEEKKQEDCSDFSDPHSSTSAVSKNNLVAFVSSEAHYSFTKAVSVTGLGIDNLVIVPTLPNGQMDVEQLDILMTQVESRSHGRSTKIPFFVAVTSGSTVRGSFDDIEAITRVCRKHEDWLNHKNQTSLANNGANLPGAKVSIKPHKIWVHVDGAWGGSAIFSSRKDIKPLMGGLHNVDSFTFNPHKMLGAPQQTTAFVTRHFGILKAANSSGAKYLFDSRKHGAEYDLGDGSYTCGRRTDAIKLWALWKYHGIDGIASKLESKVDALQQLALSVRESDRFMLACDPWPFNVNFFYLPERIRSKLIESGVDIRANSPEIPDDVSQELAEISVKLKLRLHQSGEMLIPYQPISSQKADCFRIVLAGNKSFGKNDIQKVLELMDKHGSDL